MSIQRIAIFAPLVALLLGTTFAPSEDDAGYALRSPRGDGVELGARCESDPAAHVEDAHGHLKELLGKRGSVSRKELHREVEAFIDEAFVLEKMGQRIYGDADWRRLGEHRRGRFVEALRRHLRVQLLDRFEGTAPGAVPDLRPAGSEPADNGSLHLDYWIVEGGRTEPVNFRVHRGEGTCGLVDVGQGDRTLSATIRDRVRNLTDQYFFGYMIGELGHYGYVVLEDFEDDAPEELPRGWGWKDDDDDKHKPYEVVREGDNQYLAARDEGQSVILGKEIKWNLEEYPYVSFRVRVHELPPGGDERYDDTVDSAAGLYFTYRKKMLGLIPESVKYVWSSTLPVGGAAKRSGVGRPWQVVFGSGEEGLGEWRTYVFDLREAYRDTFGGKPPSKPIGVGVLSDANSVGGKAYADYDEIRILKEAPPGTGSGVEEILRDG